MSARKLFSTSKNSKNKNNQSRAETAQNATDKASAPQIRHETDDSRVPGAVRSVASQSNTTGRESSKTGGTSAPSGDRKTRTLKDRIWGIVTFSDISIVNVVHMGFLVLLLIICGIVIITLSGLSSLSSAFSVVSDKATPLAMTAKTMETDLLLIHNDVNQILMEKDIGRIPEQESELGSMTENFRTTLDQFKKFAQDEPKLNDTIASIEEMTGNYLNDIGRIPNLRKELLTRTAEVNKQKASFAGLVRFFNNEETSFFAKIDDDFLMDSYRCMKAAQSTIESTTTTALDTEVPEKIKGYIATNQSYLKEFNMNLNDLKSEIKDLENNLGTYIASFVFDTTSPNGLLHNHLKLAEEAAEIQKAADNAKERINSIREYIKTVQDISNRAITESNSSANSIVDSSRLTLIISAIVAIIVAFFVDLLVGRSIRIPLSRIINAISSMSDGVYVGRLGYRANNEFGKLTRRIKALRLQFADVLRQVTEGSNKVKNAAEANTASATNTANGIQAQQQMTNDMVNSIEEMRASGAEMADSASETRKIVLQAGDAVTNGSEVIGRNIDTTRTLADKLTSTGELVNRVSEMSQNINSVIQVIKSIAEQTNLLALNAAIEAARAGEQGRGFAVVADEVRNLASKTSSSTNEITEVIEALQTSVSRAVLAMNECRSEMESSISQTSDVNNAIQQIQSHLNIITDYSDKIVEAASHQASSTDEVARNIRDIASISESNVEEIRKVKEACFDLNELAKSQSEWVKKFTI